MIDTSTPSGFRLARIAAGLSQGDVANRFGVALRSVRRWETVAPAPEEVREYLEDFWAGTVETACVTLDGIEKMESERGEDINEVEVHMFRNDDAAREAGFASAHQHSMRVALIAAALAVPGRSVRATYSDED